MFTKSLSRRAPVKLALIGAVLSLALVVATAGSSTSQASDPKPTIVLVHGAWADSSGWNASIKQLQNKGYTALAVATPLRSLHGDAAYLSACSPASTGPSSSSDTPTAAWC